MVNNLVVHLATRHAFMIVPPVIWNVFSSTNQCTPDMKIRALCPISGSNDTVAAKDTKVVYHLHGKPIRFEIVLIMVSKIADRKSHSDYTLSIWSD
jgi:hypothetical protein